MKFLTSAVLSAVLLAAGPAFADRGYYRDYHQDRHHWKKSHNFHKHQRPPRHVVRQEIHHYYVAQPAPVYSSPQPFGISVVLPNIFIPLD